MVRETNEYKRTTISLPPDEYETLRFVAFKRKTSVAGVMRQLINELMEDEEDIKDGMKALKDTEGAMNWETFKKECLGL